MKNEWNELEKVKPPQRKQVLVYDKSNLDIKIMSLESEDDDLNWFDENGYYDDSEPEITHWMLLPERPKSKD